MEATQVPMLRSFALHRPFAARLVMVFSVAGGTDDRLWRIGLPVTDAETVGWGVWDGAAFGWGGLGLDKPRVDVHEVTRWASRLISRTETVGDLSLRHVPDDAWCLLPGCMTCGW